MSAIYHTSFERTQALAVPGPACRSKLPYPDCGVFAGPPAGRWIGADSAGLFCQFHCC